MLAADFIVFFPEFEGVDNIQVWLDQATLMVDATVWGALAPAGVRFLAAHLMTATPAGQGAKLNNADGKSAYYFQYQLLKRSVTVGFRVA